MRSWDISIRRWTVRMLAFIAILSYGIFSLSSPKQLKWLLDVTFGTSSEEDHRHYYIDGDPPSSGFHQSSRYHKHIVLSKYANGNDGQTVGTSPASTRITFELHDPKVVPLTNVFNLYVKCPLGKVTVGRNKQPTGELRTGELPPPLTRLEKFYDRHGVVHSGRVLDFTTTISTDLKLLLVGDSVMVQLAQAFDEMMGGKDMQTRKVIWEAWRGHDGGTAVAPTRGGGVSAMWRMTGLLSKSRKGKPPANSAGGGWSDKEIDMFLKYSYPLDRNQQEFNSTIGAFDVCVIRVMHGWMKSHEITHERLVEAVELSFELLGANTVVLMTVPFTNNVKTVREMEKIKEINNDIRDIARGWSTRMNISVPHVLVLEYGTYYNHIIWSNALALGYNVTHPLNANEDIFHAEGPGFVLDRLRDAGDWPPSIPMICSDTSSLGSHRRKCNRNYLFSDGMHTCPETLASRYAAGLACLLGCVYNLKKDDLVLEERLRSCERECNKQFLSVVPVEDSWIERNMTLASFSG